MAGKYTTLPSSVTGLSTEMNSLADDGLTSLGSEISNDGTGEKDYFMKMEVFIAAQGSNRAANASVTVYVVPDFDSNYADTTDECLDNITSVTISLDDGATAARRLIKKAVPIPNANFKLALLNQTGQTLAASGNTIKYQIWTYEDA